MCTTSFRDSRSPEAHRGARPGAAVRAATAALVLGLLPVGAPSSAETPFRVADAQPADYPTVLALEYMAERARSLSGGRLTFRIYPARQLGEEKDTILATIFGAIDINRVSSAPLGTMVPELQILGLPYLFADQDHFRRVIDGDIGADILAFLEPHGMIGLAYFDAGARSFYSTRPVRTLEDFRGLKIRVQNTPLYVDMVEHLGGNATPMSFGQVYESLLTGVIDGAENNWPSYITTRHFEAAPYYTLDRHTMVPEVVMMSKKRWDELDAGQQGILRTTAREAALHMRQLWDARVAEARVAASEAGVTVIEDVDQRQFAAAAKGLLEPFMQNPVHAKLIERIRAAAAR
ncbi:MAG: TRAP transporter substrate-binding protein [Proteobacteria bacterium]|nr:TRAP transporter substrate-binding protein [Pseudomonadota bacterium]